MKTTSKIVLGLYLGIGFVSMLYFSIKFLHTLECYPMDNPTARMLITEVLYFVYKIPLMITIYKLDKN